MIVYAVYVIAEDGTTLLSENFHAADDIPDNVLLSGLVSALHQMTSDITKDTSEMRSFKIEGLTYHIKSFGLITIVLVTDVPKTPNDIMSKLGYQFINEYGDMLAQAEFKSEIFSQFKTRIYTIMQHLVGYDESKSIKPSRKLNTGEIFNLPHELQTTALALISLEEGTAKDIAKESGEKIGTTRKHLAELKEKGFIGTKKQKKKTVYFCSI